MAEVVLEKVSKRFGRVEAVKDFNLRVKDGEFMILVGPSGSGKSTVLRLIAGLEEPSSGSILIGDKKVNELSPRDRNVAMVFQSYALYPHMRVSDNLAFPLRMRRSRGELIDKRVKEAAELLEIESLLDRKPSQLSGGQRQRVALGRALVRKPEAFLLDEPLSNLDAKLRNEMRAEIKKLHKKLGATVIYVTHDQVEAMTMGDRIAVINEGMLQQVGTPDSLYNSPVNDFVADFVGTMNFFECALEEGGRVNAGEFVLELPDECKEKVKDYTGREVKAGIRPEDIKVKKAGEIEALVEVVEPMGSETLIHLRVGNKKFLARVHADVEVDEGRSVGMEINTRKLHLFDTDTSHRVG